VRKKEKAPVAASGRYHGQKEEQRRKTAAPQAILNPGAFWAWLDWVFAALLSCGYAQNKTF
jgi:hypothetical protein